jgi:predicted transcriptional regulator
MGVDPQLDELEEQRDVERGLADVEAGRVLSHEALRAEINAKWATRSKDPSAAPDRPSSKPSGLP